MAPQNQPRIHELPPVTEPAHGTRICPWCEGRRVCWYCLGAGVRDGKRCEECLGRKHCLSCDGTGLVPADQR